MNLTTIGLVTVTVGLAACGGSHLPTTPSVPPARPTFSAAAPTSPNDPVPQPAGLQPTIVAVSPNVVSTAGTWGTITGTQFQPGAVVEIGGAAVMVVFRDSTTIQFPSSGPHAPGAVDIVVSNPGGGTATLANGLTYAAADRFDANGEWIAHADGHNNYTTDMRFTITNNMLVSLSCGTPVTMPITVSLQNGGFSFAGAGRLTMSGTLASTTTSYGQVTAPGCGDGRWWAEKAVQ